MNTKITINFDMDEAWVWLDCDGTWIDLYGVPNWLTKLKNNDPSPYAEAKPLVNLAVLARTIHNLQNNGIKVGIISWLSKDSTPEYDEKVRITKLNYFKKHLPSVKFDKINIVPYGTPKSTCGFGILFDDEEKNRNDWNGIAYDEKDLIKNLIKIKQIFGQK